MKRVSYKCDNRNAEGKKLKPASHGVVICTWGRDERYSRNVPTIRACETDERCYGRSKFGQNEVSIFGLPTKHYHFVAKTAPYGAVLCARARGEIY